jgi:L-lysine 6-monooxygenase (NADPH-requiring)
MRASFLRLSEGLKVLVQGADADLPGHYNCVGVGVGPADKKETTTIQVSMLKDLVSLSEPTSEFTFLSYLHEYGRLCHYLNAQFHAVPRKEFGNYPQWACQKNENITFGNEVPSVDYSEDCPPQGGHGNRGQYRNRGRDPALGATIGRRASR